MKTKTKKYYSTKSVQFVTALILTSFLSVGSGLTVMRSAVANPANPQQEVLDEVSDGGLPLQVTNAVMQEISRTQHIPVKQLKISDYSPQTWGDGCMNLPKPNEFCTQALVSGWRVVLSDGSQNWIYHTDSHGRSLRQAKPYIISHLSKNLPVSVKKAVLQAASKRLNVPISQIRIIQTQQRTWKDGCLELSKPEEVCTQSLVEGWLITVGVINQTLVYHTNDSGSTIKLNELASEISENQLPEVVDKVLVEASRQFGLPTSKLQIVEIEQRQWPDSCLGISKPEVLCATVVVPGWLVTVSDGQQRYCYRVGQSGAIAYDENALPVGESKTLKPVPIPTSELPPALSSGVIFRQISSGGFANQTDETVLLNDGRLMQYRIGDANDSQRKVHRISRRQLIQFQYLLEKKGLPEFQNQSYSAPSGAADYITYTLTSSCGTVQYNDISQDSLPKNLQLIVKAWDRIVKNN